MTALHFDDDQLAGMLQETGSVRALARTLGVPKSSLQADLRRRGIIPPAAPRRQPPTLTRESLTQALTPPNLCKVRTFLESLPDEESRAVVQEALGYENKDLSARALRDWLVSAGCHEPDVPGQDAILSHRAGRRPCRCKG